MSPNRRFDVVVVGAGPAGSSAAYDLASAGVRVALLDRFHFPRAKACGGALTAKAVMAIRFSIAPVVRAVVRDFGAGRELERFAVFEGSSSIGVTTVRSELDAFLLEKSIEAGAQFFRVSGLRSLREGDGECVLETEGEKFSCRFLIGADGANSTVRRLCRGFEGIRQGFAIEAKVDSEGDQAPRFDFDFGVASRGYGWMFPKGDHYNVGLYTYDAALMVSVPQLVSYVKRKIGYRKLREVIGHPVGLGGWDFVPRGNRVFLVGDAAGLCEPILGEGIYYAVRSGQMAAKAIVGEIEGGEAAGQRYRQRVRRLTRDLGTTWFACMRFYRDLGIGFQMLKSRLVRGALMKGYAAGVPFGEIVRGLHTLPFRPLADVEGKLNASWSGTKL